MPGSTDDESSDPQRHAGSSTEEQTGGGRRKRVRLFTPAERAAHRVVEKQRREALNSQFIELARLLPGLAKTRRLSKSVIVNESIAHQKKQRAERLACARQLRAMRNEQASLVAEVNALREKLGITERRESSGDALEEGEDVDLPHEEVNGAFPAALVDEGEEDARGAGVNSAADPDAERGRSGRRAPSSRSKTSASDSASRNASERGASASPARVSSWINGVVQAAALLPTTMPQPPPRPSHSFMPVGANPATVPYDTDFLSMAIFPDPSLNPTNPAFPTFYRTSAAEPNMRYPGADFAVNQLPFVQPLPPSYHFAAYAQSPHAHDPSPEALSGDLSSINFGSLEEYPPLPQSQPTLYPLEYPPVPVHLGSYGGFPGV